MWLVEQVVSLKQVMVEGMDHFTSHFVPVLLSIDEELSAFDRTEGELPEAELFHAKQTVQGLKRHRNNSRCLEIWVATHKSATRRPGLPHNLTLREFENGPFRRRTVLDDGRHVCT